MFKGKKITAMNKTGIFCWLLLLILFSSCAGLKKSSDQEVALTSPVSQKVEEEGQAPPSLYYNFLMAQMYRSQGDAEGAIKHYNLALSYDPDSPVLLFDIASLYIQTGKLEEAQQACLKIVQRDPANLHAHLLL